MNILYLHTHDTGRCVSPYGYAADTPNLQKLAEDGMLFRQAFDCGPTCSPARAALLTGQHPHQCGMLGLAHRGFALSDTSHHLASFLRANGYRTVLSGIQHEAGENEKAALGYDECFRGHFHHADRGRELMGFDEVNTAWACDYVRRHDPAKPLFLSLGLICTHRPFPGKSDAADSPAHVHPPAPIPDTPECREDWAAFLTMVRHADTCFGKVLQTLEETGMARDTLVLVTTDHGPAFPGMKCNLNDNGCGVMMMLRGPGVKPAMVSDALVSHIDVFPTLCELAGLDKPAWLEGKSLVPLMNGEVAKINDAVFSEITFHAATDMQRAVRTERFWYVRRIDDYPGIVLPNIDDGLTKRFLLENAGLADKPRIPREQLFDVYHDPSCCNSVANNPEYAETLAALRTKLDAWMNATDDPLRNGPMQQPDNTVLNPQSGIDPN